MVLRGGSQSFDSFRSLLNWVSLHRSQGSPGRPDPKKIYPMTNFFTKPKWAIWPDLEKMARFWPDFFFSYNPIWLSRENPHEMSQSRVDFTKMFYLFPWLIFFSKTWLKGNFFLPRKVSQFKGKGTQICLNHSTNIMLTSVQAYHNRPSTCWFPTFPFKNTWTFFVTCFFAWCI